MHRLIARSLLTCLFLASCGGDSPGDDAPPADTEQVDATNGDAEETDTGEDGVTVDTQEEDVQPMGDVDAGDLCSDKLDPDAHCASLADLGPCEDVTCSEEGECVVSETPAPACCESDADCEDESPLTFTWCPGSGDACMTQPNPLACPDTTVLLDTSFTDGTLQGWMVDNTPADSVVGWRIASRRVNTGAFSAAFIRKDCPTHYAGPLEPDCTLPGQPITTDVHEGTLVSKILELPPSAPAVLSIQLFAQMELATNPGTPCATNPNIPNCYSPEAESQFDNLQVEVTWDEVGENGAQESKTTTLWSIQDLVTPSTTALKTTGGGFHREVLDLSPWQGQSIRLKIRARMDGTEATLFEGAAVDSIRVHTYCDAQACESDDDCNTPNPCLDKACTEITGGVGGGVCLQDPVSEGCIPCPGLNSASCEDGDPCTTGICTSDATCQQQPNGTCCVESVHGDVLTFDSGSFPVGWDTTAGVGGVNWNVTTKDPAHGTHHLYFGNPVTGHYDAGKRVQSTIHTGFIPIPENSLSVTVNMALKLATQYEQGAYLEGQLPYDQFTIEVIEHLGGVEKSTPIFDSLSAPFWGATGDHSGLGSAVYTPLGLDLSAWRGRVIRLALTFDSWDEGNNVYDGVFIDNFALQIGCNPPQCTGSEFCDDGSGCTEDTCAGSYCTFIPTDALCCEADLDCDDGNACTSDDCQSGQCVFVPEEDADCCSEASMVIAHFEGENSGWKMLPPGATIGWNILNNPIAHSGFGALHHGHPLEGVYGGSEAEADPTYAVSPDFTVPTHGTGTLHFWMKSTTPDPADALELMVLSASGDPTVVWSAVMGAFTTIESSIEHSVDLSAWAGESISLGFRFTTAPKSVPVPGAIWIDALVLETTCETTP